MEMSNYDITREQAKKIFLQYDQKEIIRKWKLSYDASYLYVKFVNREYRINRETGTIEWSKNGFADAIEADFNVTLTIFDILCCSKEGCHATGQYDILKNLKGTGCGGDPGRDIYDPYKKIFDKKSDLLSMACTELVGEPFAVGDVAYIIPVFGDLKMLFQFWESDDEFEAEMKLKWDTNVLSYMRFETVYYAMGHVLQRLKEIMN